MSKKAIILLIIIIVFAAVVFLCNSHHYIPENEFFPRVVINGTQFRTSYSFKYVNAPDNSSICGTITSYTDGIPSEHEQTNFFAFLNQPYALIGNTLVVRVNLEKKNNSNQIEKWVELIEIEK